MRISGIFSIALLLPLSNSIYGLDEESAKERRCFKIKKTVPVYMEWVSSLKTFYFPASSRLDLYRLAASLTARDFEDITEDELYYNGCISFSLSSVGDFVINGFSGGSVRISVRPQSSGMEKFEFGDDDEGNSGYCHTTLTDNKTFIVMACCKNGDEMAWAAISPKTILAKETVKMIHAHVDALGFSREQFTGLRYDTCHKMGIMKKCD